MLPLSVMVLLTKKVAFWLNGMSSIGPFHAVWAQSGGLFALRQRASDLRRVQDCDLSGERRIARYPYSVTSFLKFAKTD
jgi:hypothetical protein